MEQTTSSTCLICLGVVDPPKNLYDANYKRLLELLLQLLSFQIEIHATVFNICPSCEGKLVWVEEFKDICEKSLERFKKIDFKKEFIDLHEYDLLLQKNESNKQTKLLECDSDKEIITPRRRKKVLIRKEISTRKLRNHKEVQNGTQQNELKDVIKDLDNTSTLKEEDISNQKQFDSSDIEDDPPYVSDKEDDSSDFYTKDVPKRTRRKVKRSRLKTVKRRRKGSIDYCETEVLKAIADCESYMTDIKHRKCIHCDFEAVNLKSMWIHMPLKHKIEYPSWCKHCNIQTEDLEKHRNVIRCFEDHCKFCKTVCPNKNVLLKHLQSHCANNTIEETKQKTNKQFSKEEVLKAIESTTKYMTDLKYRTCTYCTLVAARNKTLAVHIKVRHRQYYDTWCSRCNLQTDDLKAHLKSTRCYECVCPLCDKTYNRINRLTIHLKSHCRDGFTEEDVNVKNDWDEDDDFIPCAEEESATLKKESIFSDEEELPDQSSKENDKSDKTVDKKRKINRLPRRMPKKKVQKMLTDSLKSFYISRKYPHIARHKNDLQTFCLICKKKVRSIKCHNLTKHKTLQVKKKRPSGPANTLCTVCGKIFKNSQILKVHMRLCTGDKAFKCSFCEKLLPNKTYLRDHERRHTGEKPFLCPICGRGFVSNGEQKQHMKIHEGGPVTCTICNKEFNRPGVLELHMKRHTGENPFKCIHCEMSYHRASLLKNHMRSHSNERPFKCSFCDKDFSCKSTLRKHENVHKGIKPYKCSVCSFSCGQAHGLSSHMKQHPEDPPLPDRPYKCLFCYRQFDTNAMLMSHTNNQHREQTPRE